MDPPAHARELVLRGYTVFPDLLGDAVDAFRRLADRAADRMTPIGPGQAPAYLSGLLEHSPSLVLETVATPHILEFAELTIGPFVQLDSSVLSSSPTVDAKERGSVVEWHRDRYGYLPCGVYQPPTAIVFLCYLQDMSPDRGLLRVIPGSHVAPVRIDDALLHLPHPDELLLPVRAGDAVALHHNLLHSATANVAGGPRIFFGFTYSHTALRGDDGLNGPAARDWLARARDAGDRRLRRLLGEDETLNARINSGFTRSRRDDWESWSRADDDSGGTPIFGAVQTGRWYASQPSPPADRPTATFQRPPGGH
jgi:hypothetical protein